MFQSLNGHSQGHAWSGCVMFFYNVWLASPMRGKSGLMGITSSDIDILAFAGSAHSRKQVC